MRTSSPRRSTPKRSEAGFTLIELMIVVVIVGVLAALAIPRFSGASTVTKQHEAHLILKQLYTLQHVYYEHHSTFADDLAHLTRYGWTTPVLKYYDVPTITTGAGSFDACMAAVNPTSLGDRGIDQDGVIDAC